MTEVTQALARYVTGLRYEDLPGEVVEKSKQLVLDLLGIALRASVEAESSESVRKTVEMIAGPGDATVVGATTTMSPAHAALINGMYAHSLDFDDTHREGSVHPGASVIPALLALAEQERLGGRRMLAAMVAGYEVVCRLCMALNAKAHYDRGFHPTATAGVFGATAAGANLLGSSEQELLNAFGINGSQAAGSLQFLDNGAWNKRLHPGLAAHNGILALLLARNGFLGATRPLEGTYGLLNGYSDKSDAGKLLDGLGESFEILRTAVKPYPACRYAHAPLDAIIDLVREHQIKADEVESVNIGLSDAGVVMIGRPIERKRRVENVVDGQFSMPFLAAVALKRGRMNWGDYELVGDAGVNALMQRIEVNPDDEANRVYPDKWMATVSIRARGKEFTDRRWKTRGEAEAPLTWEDIEAKFDDLASAAISAEQRARVIQTVRNLEQVEDLRELGRLLRRQAGPPGRLRAGTVASRLANQGRNSRC